MKSLLLIGGLPLLALSVVCGKINQHVLHDKNVRRTKSVAIIGRLTLLFFLKKNNNEN